jgi:hypothetical protein
MFDQDFILLLAGLADDAGVSSCSSWALFFRAMSTGELAYEFRSYEGIQRKGIPT